MKCLVFGGAGFIGSHLCDALVSSGHEVTVVDKFLGTADNLHKIAGKYRRIIADFCQVNDFSHLLQQQEVVFHFISTTTPRSSNLNMLGDLSDNVLSTLRLLDACRKSSSLKKFVYLSSGGTVYGNPHQLPIEEDHPTNPLCSYGIHKLAIEKYLLLYSHLFDLNVTIIRLGYFTYSIRAWLEADNRVISRTNRIIQDMVFKITGPKRQSGSRGSFFGNVAIRNNLWWMENPRQCRAFGA